jgi:hypothetical protein
MDDPAKCAVLVPVASTIEPETEDCLRALSACGYPVRILRGCSQVDLARSALASAAVDDGFAETLWIDSDIVFDPADVEKLRAHHRPLTAGLYVKKGAPEFAGKFRNEGSMTFGKGGGLIEMEFVGMGFTHIRREVYQRVDRDQKLPRCGGGYDPAKLVVPYFIPTVAPDGAGGWCYLSEDYSFCSRARQCGYPAFADTTIRLGHGVGPYKRTWDDLNPRQAVESLQIMATLPKVRKVA